MVSTILSSAAKIPSAEAKEIANKYEFSKEFLRKELDRCEELEVKYLVLHPGSSVKIERNVAIDNIVRAINDITKEEDKCIILLETMAGKGTEIGITFEQIRAIIDQCHYPERLGVCLDTCHISDAGYDIHDVDGILKEFDRVIGLDKLLVVHINDSKNPRGAHKDRHENIGYGFIGFDTIKKWVWHPLLDGIPKILETPYFNEKPPYKQEIKMLRDGQYIEGWRDKEF